MYIIHHYGNFILKMPVFSPGYARIETRSIPSSDFTIKFTQGFLIVSERKNCQRIPPRTGDGGEALLENAQLYNK